MFKRITQSLIFRRQICNTLKCKCSASELAKAWPIDPEPPEESDEAKQKRLTEMRNKYPEFLPNPELNRRNTVRELLERQDMLKRRKNLHIPEFYVGSILAVTTSDVNVPSKTVRFLGICITRMEQGLRSKFLLRNVVHSEGIEVLYSLYSPLIQKIEVIKLEKRLDNELFYLRDAPLEYSTFPFDMEAQYIDEKSEAPINTIKVPLNPRPWYERWERKNLQGAILPPLNQKIMRKAEKHKKPWEKYDLMDHYRKMTPEEDQEDIFKEISQTFNQLQSKAKSKKQNASTAEKTNPTSS